MPRCLVVERKTRVVLQPLRDGLGINFLKLKGMDLPRLVYVKLFLQRTQGILL